MDVTTTSKAYLIFRLHRALFALAAMAVREVLPLPAIAAVAETPPYVIGAINLRGRVVPIIDLNLRFGHPTVPCRPDDALVIVEANDLQAGIIVSEALEVVDIPPRLIEPPPLPESPERVFPPFVIGNARVDEDLVMVLDHNLLILWSERGGWLPEILPGTPDEADYELARQTAGVNADVAYRQQEIFRRRALDLLAAPQSAGDETASPLAAILLGDEFFGIEFGQVLEFSEIHNLTPLPNCPSHVVGTMNLRGRALTVLDLRGFLGLPARKFTSSAQVVIATAAGHTAGIAVNEIHEIVWFHASELAPLTTVVESWASPVARGTLPYQGKSLTVLDLEVLFADQRLVVKPPVDTEGTV
jgi:purine-binding chemotaxis protein CheW